MMGICGFEVLSYVNPFLMGGFVYPILAGFALNWLRMTLGYMLYTVRKIELHRDGRTVTVHPAIGSPY